jgi:outer membrane protein OmpA-like peptidoglycan-associated protein/uncharacterized protein YidB (DUF937 family)
MALFDALIREVAQKFNLGSGADRLVTEILRFIGNEQTGGISGFLDRFRKAGLSDLVTSWVGRGENRPLATGQMEQALGSGFLGQIAGKLGLPAGSLGAPIAYLIPKVIDLLTPDGTVPSKLPASVATLLSAAPAAAAVHPAHAEKSFLARYWWLALLALIAIIGYFAFLRPEQKVTTTPPATTAQPVAQVQPKLAITNDNGQVRYGGVVKDEQTRTTIVDQLKRVFGEGNIFGNIAIDPNAGPAAWLAKLGTALESFKVPGLEAVFDGANVWLGGAISEVEKSALMEKLKGLFGAGFSFGSLADRAEGAIRSATDKTLAAIAALKPGFTGSDLVKALNLAIINFETGSANLSASAKAFLAQVAAAMKAAPANTRLEIRGHTDTVGDPASNLALSQARAETVRVTLVEMGVPAAMLSAKGLGDTQPVASNDTPDGRFQNRRIEFVVVE